MGMDDEARQLWAASYFLRQAHRRDLTKATRVLRHLVRHSRNARIADRAAKVLAQYESEQARQTGA